jgi:hypothetical protein
MPVSLERSALDPVNETNSIPAFGGMNRKSRLSHNEIMKASKLPVRKLTEVAHVGQLIPSEKRNGSYEGRCLSVSTAPVSWASIAKLGDRGFILKGRGNFLDALALDLTHREAIVEWAVNAGLLISHEVARLHTLDTELNEWCFTDFGSSEKAEEEIEWIDDDPYRLEFLTVYVATQTLVKGSGWKIGHISSSVSLDLALVEFASRDPELDGVWWQERLDVSRFSAPRGGIFPHRVSEFQACAATWAQLERFEGTATCLGACGRQDSNTQSW